MKKKILFLCTGNSCRSQMAEGWCNFFYRDQFDCYSAGTEKHGMNQRAIKVMSEAGVDISQHFSKTIDELPQVKFDLVITVCDAAKEACPYFSAGKLVHHSFQDPPRLTKDMVDEVEMITSDHLPEEISGYKGPSSTLTLNEVMEEAERHTIINYLEVLNGNKSGTAKALGISRTTLYEKMKKYGL